MFELTKSNPGSSSSSFFDTLKVGNIALFVLAKFENELELVNSSLYFTYQCAIGKLNFPLKLPYFATVVCRFAQ